MTPWHSVRRRWAHRGRAQLIQRRLQLRDRLLQLQCSFALRGDSGVVGSVAALGLPGLTASARMSNPSAWKVSASMIGPSGRASSAMMDSQMTAGRPWLVCLMCGRRCATAGAGLLYGARGGGAGRRAAAAAAAARARNRNRNPRGVNSLFVY
eukprot:COSAG01_NODE_1605_length_9753_cov_46.460798_6_plen_153_part_00